jgi:hypothetical protein
MEALAMNNYCLTTADIAATIDAVSKPHALLTCVVLANTGAKVQALLNADASCVDLAKARLRLGGEQSRPGHRRHDQIITGTLAPWLANLPAGPLVSYRGQNVGNIRSALSAASQRAGVAVPVTGAGIREALVHHLQAQQIDISQIGLFLGMRQLSNGWLTARQVDQRTIEAVESFVRQINASTRNWDLLIPYTRKHSDV